MQRVLCFNSHSRCFTSRLPSFAASFSSSIRIESSNNLGRDVVTASHISQALFGLRNSSLNDGRHVSTSLQEIIFKFDHCREKFTSNDISQSFYGLRRMSSVSPDVLKVVSLLSQKVSTCSDVMDPPSLCQSLLGMLLCDDFVETLLICCCVIGLQEMSSFYPEVRSVIGALTVHINKCPKAFTKEELGMAFYALKNCTNMHNEVCLLLMALRDQLNRCCPKKIGSQHDNGGGSSSRDSQGSEGLQVLDEEMAYISNVLYGLQCMTNKPNCIKTKIKVEGQLALLDVISTLTAELLGLTEDKPNVFVHPSRLADSFYGLSNMLLILAQQVGCISMCVANDLCKHGLSI